MNIAEEIEALVSRARHVRHREEFAATLILLSGEVMNDTFSRIIMQHLVEATPTKVADELQMPRCLETVAARVQLYLYSAKRRETSGVRDFGAKPYVVSPNTVSLLLVVYVNYVAFHNGYELSIMVHDIDH